MAMKWTALPAQVMSVGSDGLMKLWNVRASECVATLEEHEGKVWALAGQLLCPVGDPLADQQAACCLCM